MKKKSTKRMRKKAGLSPGSVIFTGNRKVENILLHYLQYNSDFVKETVIDKPENITSLQTQEGQINWYDLRGLHDTSLIELLGKTFGIHPLVQEDIADPHQRPKFEEYEKGNFLVMRALSFDKTQLKVKTEQVAVYFNRGFVISFQETDSDLFEAVRLRIHNGRGRIRSRDADYLTYALADSVVDNYFFILDEVEAEIERLEDELLANPGNEIKEKIHHLKKELLVVRKIIYPLREAISRFSKSETPFSDDESRPFIRDLYDHTIQVMDMVESYRDVLNGLQDLYLSEISFRMNQVMQVLTIIATIFIPLTFLAGIYGMNFENMPELRWKYSYFLLWCVMIVTALALVIFFRRRKWL